MNTPLNTAKSNILNKYNLHSLKKMTVYYYHPICSQTKEEIK